MSEDNDDDNSNNDDNTDIPGDDNAETGSIGSTDTQEDPTPRLALRELIAAFSRLPPEDNNDNKASTERTNCSVLPATTRKQRDETTDQHKISNQTKQRDETTDQHQNKQPNKTMGRNNGPTKKAQLSYMD